MQAFQSVVFAISRAAAVLGCLILVAMVGHIIVEIVMRSFFATSTYVLDEFVGYGVAAVTFLALGYSLEHGSIIRVTLLIGRVEGKARRFLEILSAVATIFVVSVLIWFFWLRAARNWRQNTVSSSIAEIPMWIPEAGILLGLCVFWLQLIAYLLRHIADTPPPVPLSAQTMSE